MIFYDWSGGMESSAMLVIDRERIREMGAIVRFADTGKQFPELYQSKAQIEQILGIEIVTVPRRIDFDTYLFERGGMIRKGTNDCSKKMKRSNLFRDTCAHSKNPMKSTSDSTSKSWTGADDFTRLNERDYLHWRYPLIEAKIERLPTWPICREAGFTILIEVYERMGRMDCFMCGNQKESQALKVVKYYPDLATEWNGMEERKGDSFMPVALKVLVNYSQRQGELFAESPIRCSCFGGNDDATGEDEIEGEQRG